MGKITLLILKTNKHLPLTVNWSAFWCNSYWYPGALTLWGSSCSRGGKAKKLYFYYNVTYHQYTRVAFCVTVMLWGFDTRGQYNLRTEKKKKYYHVETHDIFLRKYLNGLDVCLWFAATRLTYQGAGARYEEWKKMTLFSYHWQLTHFLLNSTVRWTFV